MRERLVEHERPGAAGHRRGESHALQLAPGQRAGVAVAEVLRARAGEGGSDRGGDLGGGEPAPAGRERDLAQHLRLDDGVGGLLRDEPEARGPVAGSPGGGALAEHGGPAGDRAVAAAREGAGEQAQNRGFSAAARTGEHDELARRHAHRRGAHLRPGGEGIGRAVELDRAHDDTRRKDAAKGTASAQARTVYSRPGTRTWSAMYQGAKYSRKSTT